METKEQYHLELVSIWKSIVVFLSPIILAIFFFSLANWFQLIGQSKNLDNVIRAVMLIIYIMLAINWRKLTPTYTRIIKLGLDFLEVQDSNEKILLDKIKWIRVDEHSPIAVGISIGIKGRLLPLYLYVQRPTRKSSKYKTNYECLDLLHRHLTQQVNHEVINSE